MGAQLIGEFLLVFAASDGDRPEPELARELHAEMSQAADALYSDKVPAPRAAVAKCVVSRDAGAHDRTGAHAFKIAGNPGKPLDRVDYVLGIAAVVSKAWDAQALAIDEVAAPAWFACGAMAAVPADAYALPKLPGYDSLANCVDNARDLVSRNSGILQAGPMPFFYEGIAVTDEPGYCVSLRYDHSMTLKCLSCFIVGASLFAQNPGDDAAVREIVKKYVDAREQKDPQAIEALFTSDADQLVSSGEWRKGRGEVVKGTMASSQNSGGRRTIAVESIRFVAPGVALADGRYEITGMAGGENRKMWTSLVLTRGANGWRIAAIRNMLPSR